MASSMHFPPLQGRDLEGREVDLPGAFEGERNVVVIAFRRHQQVLVDSWAGWFEERSRVDPGLRFYELPTIDRWWKPIRRFIDGGMAAAIRDQIVLRRTFTIYGHVGRATRPLGIDDRSTITVLCVDRSGEVLWRGTGACTAPLARELESVMGTAS